MRKKILTSSVLLALLTGCESHADRVAQARKDQAIAEIHYIGASVRLDSLGDAFLRGTVDTETFEQTRARVVADYDAAYEEYIRARRRYNALLR